MPLDNTILGFEKLSLLLITFQMIILLFEDANLAFLHLHPLTTRKDDA